MLISGQNRKMPYSASNGSTTATLANVDNHLLRVPAAATSGSGSAGASRAAGVTDVLIAAYLSAM
ncbi:hypothetical protein GCM10010399_02180 [Dactylosporangium fulvum]